MHPFSFEVLAGKRGDSAHQPLQPARRALALQGHHASKLPACGHELSRRALLGHYAILEHHDLVGALHRAHAVRDHDDGLARQQSAQSLPHLYLILNVKTCRGLVQQHNRRVHDGMVARLSTQ